MYKYILLFSSFFFLFGFSAFALVSGPIDSGDLVSLSCNSSDDSVVFWSSSYPDSPDPNINVGLGGQSGTHGNLGGHPSDSCSVLDSGGFHWSDIFEPFGGTDTYHIVELSGVDSSCPLSVNDKSFSDCVSSLDYVADTEVEYSGPEPTPTPTPTPTPDLSPVGIGFYSLGTASPGFVFVDFSPIVFALAILIFLAVFAIIVFYFKGRVRTI